MTRIIIGNGKLAQAIKKTHDVVLSHGDIEITNEPGELAKIIRKASEHAIMSADVVINTAAKINLEWCEENKTECWKINALGPLKLAKACDILGLKFVHISSGCIFDGMTTDRVYTEDDRPSPASFYAIAKAQADVYLEQANLDIPILTLRPRQIISANPHPTNMLTKFTKIGKSPRFITSANSVTGIEDFSLMIDHLLKNNAIGVYNCASHGTISPYEIAVKMKAIVPDFNPQPVEYADYIKSIKVKRVNTILDVKKLQASGFVTRSAEQVVDWCIANYGKVG